MGGPAAGTPGAAARGKPDHCLWLTEGGVLRRDDEVGALRDLRPAAVRDTVDRSEDGLPQFAQGVQRPVEVLRCRSHPSLVMFLRCRRSLPTENARLPAPVMITTRTAGRTAIVSRTSVRLAPISVVMALSACGLFNVITAIDSPAAYSRSTGLSGSSPSGGGGPKSSAFHRSVSVELGAMAPPVWVDRPRW